MDLFLFSPCLSAYCSNMHIITDPRCVEYSSPGHPERPARISRTVEFLKKGEGISGIEWHEPSVVDLKQVERAHVPDLIQMVKNEAAFDADTPSYENIFGHTSRSVGGALKALEMMGKGERAFSLLRPPGHHATRSRAMGFCYFNAIAIAALEAREQGAGKVCVFDFDVHHGNGTEAILKDEKGMAFYSIHQHPCYPGTGSENVGKNCFNYPVSPGLDRWEYRKVIKRAFQDLLSQKPDVIGVSAGVDAYARDPLAQMTLLDEDFKWMGEMIRESKVPAFSVLEGGYSDDLPVLINAYLEGWAG